MEASEETSYTLVFAGQRGVGKTTIFKYLKLLAEKNGATCSTSSNGHQFETTIESTKVSQAAKVEMLCHAIHCGRYRSLTHYTVLAVCTHTSTL